MTDTVEEVFFSIILGLAGGTAIGLTLIAGNLVNVYLLAHREQQEAKTIMCSTRTTAQAICQHCDRSAMVRKIAASLPVTEALVVRGEDLFDNHQHVYIRRGLDEPEYYEWWSLCYIMRDPLFAERDGASCEECEARLTQLQELAEPLAGTEVEL